MLLAYLRQIKVMKEIKFPYVLRAAAGLVSVGLIVAGVVLGSSFIFTLYFSFLMALLIRPVVIFFERRVKLPPSLAILVSLIFAFSVFALILYGVMYQMGSFVSEWPAIKKHLLDEISNLQKWITSELKISTIQQADYVDQARERMDGGSAVITSTLLSVKDFLLNLFLVPIYMFLILYYHRLLTLFLLQSFGESNIQRIVDTIAGVKRVIQSYIVGLMIELCVVATLNATGLLIIGIKYAVLLGVLGGFLNLIPYIGTMMAGIIAVAVAFSTGADLGQLLAILGVYTLVQFIDNNILMPNIVGGKVKVNALASILGVVVGGTIGGVAGMFLAVPTIAILKVIFDHSEHLTNWGTLLGDDIPQATVDLTGIKNYLRKIHIYPASATIPVMPAEEPAEKPGEGKIILPD